MAFWRIGRRQEPPPRTDLQMRLQVIMDRAKGIESKAKSEKNQDMEALAYCVIYLAGIVKKHFQTDEK